MKKLSSEYEALKKDLKKMKTKVIPYSRQSISKADIESVKTLISDFLTTGPKYPNLKKKFQNF